MFKQLAGKIFGFSFVSIISGLLSIITVPFATRFYSAEQLGYINFFFATTSVLIVFLTLGLDQGYTRFAVTISEQERVRLMFKNIVLSTIFLMIGVTIVAIYQEQLSQLIFDITSAPVTFWYASTLLCLAILRHFSIEARIKMSVLNYTFLAGLMALIQKGLYLPSALIKTNYQTAISFVSFASLGILLIILTHYRKWYIPRGSGRLSVDSSDYYRYSTPLLFSALIAALVVYIPQLTLRVFHGSEMFAYLSVAVTVAMVIQILQGGFNTFWAPFVFGNHNSQLALIKKAHRFLVFVSIFLCTLIAINIDLVFLLIGSEFSDAAQYVPALMLVPVCYSIGETTSVGIRITYKSHLDTLISVISLCVSVIASLLLIPKFSLLGASISASLTSLVNLGLRSYFGSREFRSVDSWSLLVRSIGLYILVCFAAIVANDDPLVRISVQIICLVFLVFTFGYRNFISMLSSLFQLLTDRRK